MSRRDLIRMTDDEVQEFLNGRHVMNIATFGPDGNIHLVAMWYGFINGNTAIETFAKSQKVRNVERDPRTVISMDAPRTPGVFLNPYAVVHAHATVEPSDEAWDLLDRLAKVYVSPDTTFPAPQRPGFVIRYRIERIGGVGPWVASNS